MIGRAQAWLGRPSASPSGMATDGVTSRSAESRTRDAFPQAEVRAWWSRFRQAQTGVAMIEFAIIAPTIILLLCGGFEISRYVKTVRQITNVANTIAEILSQNTSGNVNDTDLHFFFDTAMIVYPDSLSNAFARSTYWWLDLQISMSSIAFTPTVNGCTSNCTYTAKAIWTSSSSFQRPCSVQLTPAPDSALPSQTTLPADSYGPGTIIAVDVHYTYRPLIAAQFIGNINIARSFFIQPRYVTRVNYQPNFGDMATQCP